MAKRYTSFKTVLTWNESKRSDILKYWSNERQSNLVEKFVECLENDIRLTIDKRNIIACIDYFQGAYIYLQFFNTHCESGKQCIKEAKELLSELEIPTEDAQYGFFIEKDEFIKAYKNTEETDYLYK